MGRVDSSCSDDQFANSFFIGGEPVAGDKTKTLDVPGFLPGTAPGSYAGGNYPYATPCSPYADSNWQDPQSASTLAHTPGAPMSSAQVVTPADAAASGGHLARKAQQRKSSQKNRKNAAAATRALVERGAALEAKNAELEDQLAGARRANSGLAFQVTALKMKAARVDELLEQNATLTALEMKAARVDELLEQNATLEGKNAELERENAEYAGAAGAVAEIAAAANQDQRETMKALKKQHQKQQAAMKTRENKAAAREVHVRVLEQAATSTLVQQRDRGVKIAQLESALQGQMKENAAHAAAVRRLEQKVTVLSKRPSKNVVEATARDAKLRQDAAVKAMEERILVDMAVYQEGLLQHIDPCEGSDCSASLEYYECCLKCVQIATPAAVRAMQQYVVEWLVEASPALKLTLDADWKRKLMSETSLKAVRKDCVQYSKVHSGVLLARPDRLLCVQMDETEVEQVSIQSLVVTTMEDTTVRDAFIVPEILASKTAVSCKDACLAAVASCAEGVSECALMLDAAVDKQVFPQMFDEGDWAALDRFGELGVSAGAALFGDARQVDLARVESSLQDHCNTAQSAAAEVARAAKSVAAMEKYYGAGAWAGFGAAEKAEKQSLHIGGCHMHGRNIGFNAGQKAVQAIIAPLVATGVAAAKAGGIYIDGTAESSLRSLMKFTSNTTKINYLSAGAEIQQWMAGEQRYDSTPVEATRSTRTSGLAHSRVLRGWCCASSRRGCEGSSRRR